jgi:hypothetical protein
MHQYNTKTLTKNDLLNHATKQVKHVLKINPHKIKIRSVLADYGANDTNKNFRYLEKNRIVPGIKVKNNFIVTSRNNKIRNKEVKIQSKDLLKWKKKGSMDIDG